MKKATLVLVLLVVSSSCFAAKFCREDFYTAEYEVYTGILIQKERFPGVQTLPNPYWVVKLDKAITKGDKKIEEIELWYDNAFKNLKLKPFLKSGGATKRVELCGWIEEFRGSYYLKVVDIVLAHNTSFHPTPQTARRV